MEAEERPYQPSLSHRFASSTTLGLVGFLCRTFAYGLNRTTVNGLDPFLEVLENRRDVDGRERGLITVSNHTSVMDDPLIWGVLPFRYHWRQNDMRWSLGSYDICFKNKFLESFFTYGNTLPTHRAAHSKYGGLFQPTMTQVIRLLSDPHRSPLSKARSLVPETVNVLSSLPPSDPFSSSQLTYSTNGLDSFPAPSAYPSRRFSWIHIFPEGMIHQHPDKVMRYFKWGVARLILEAEPCPDVVPMWIDGPQNVMSEKREWPRFIPRAGADITVNFGDLVDREAVWGPFRQRWADLKEKARLKNAPGTQPGVLVKSEDVELGILRDHDLMYSAEAEQLRVEVTMAIRNEVLNVRRKATGLPDEDPKRSLASTFKAEAWDYYGTAKPEKADGSIVKEE